MFKKGLYIIFIFLTLIIFTSCQTKVETFEPIKPEITSDNFIEMSSTAPRYIFDLNFNKDKNILIGNLRLFYFNSEDSSLDRLYFHLYPNAFSKKDSVPLMRDVFKQFYPNGFDDGYIKVKNVKINGKKASFKVKDTILEIKLQEPVGIGENKNIEMDFEVKIPNCRNRFGYYNNVYTFSHSLPQLAVYDQNGWNLDPYYRVGEPFYSDASFYKVKLKAPKEMVFVGTGQLKNEEVKGTNKIWEWETTLVRDFTFAGSSDFKVEKRTIEGIDVYCYNKINRYNDYIFKILEESFRFFNRYISKYPYKQFSVVFNGFNSGMEYSQLVTLNEEYLGNLNLGDQKSVIQFSRILVHETVHQWWYGLVGSNSSKHAFLDEGLTSYCTHLFFKKVARINFLIEYRLKSWEEYKEKAGHDVSLSLPVTSFSDAYDYYIQAYYKGAAFFHAIHNELNDTVFQLILREYYDRYEYKIATPRDFFEVVEYVSKGDWKNFYNNWMK